VTNVVIGHIRANTMEDILYVICFEQ